MMKTANLLFLMLFSWSMASAADWSLPLSFQSGAASTSLTLGIQAGAGNGFDAGRDVPGRPYEADDSLFASFPHPEWGIKLGGEPVYDYSRDIRGILPQEFRFEVISKQPQVTLSWNPAGLPPKTGFLLVNSLSGTSIDMAARSSYSFNPGGTAPVGLSIQVSQGDVSPPSVPYGVRIDERESSLYVSWERNSEADLAGYMVHFGTDSGRYSRSIDVRNVTNYSLFNLDPEETYYVAVTAYDSAGNASGYSSQVSGRYRFDAEPPLNPVGLRVTATQTTLTLSWDANLESDLAGYRVYLGTSYGQYSSPVNVGLKTAYQVVNPVAGQTYYFVVSAHDGKGNESSLSSSVSGALAVNSTPGEETTAPGVPDEKDVLPAGDEPASAATPVGSSRASVIYVGLPGQAGAPRQRSPEERTQAEERQEKTGNGEETASPPDIQRPGKEGKSGELTATSGVFGKPDLHRLELDESLWKLMTIPLRIPANDPFAEFVARNAEISRLIGWDSEKQVYRQLRYPRPGAAFWLRAGKGYAVLKGQPYRGGEAVLPLVKGWNLIGSPYLEAIPFRQVRIRGKESLSTLTQAVHSGLLANELQSYFSGDFVHESLDREGRLEPWRGYWVFAKEACEMILHAGPVSEGQVVEQTEERPTAAPHSSL